MKILVIEDEVPLGQCLGEGLAEDAGRFARTAARCWRWGLLFGAPFIEVLFAFHTVN